MRRRGINDSILIKWTLVMIYVQDVCDKIERYCDTASATPDQHVDIRTSRISRDDTDVNKVIQC